MTSLTAVMFAVTPEEVMYGYGPLGVGVVVLCIAVYRLFTIIVKDRDKAIADRDSMVQDLFTKVLPAIARNTDVLERQQEIDRQLIETIKESNRRFDEMRTIWMQGINRAGGT